MLLEPLGQQGRELTRYIIGFVNNMKVGVLGSVGLAVLIYTVVSLVQKVEEAFNYIWGVRQSRPLIRRFSDYMSVILVGPVLVFSALGITAAVMGSNIVQSLSAVQPFAAFIDAVSRLESKSEFGQRFGDTFMRLKNQEFEMREREQASRIWLKPGGWIEDAAPASRLNPFVPRLG